MGRFLGDAAVDVNGSMDAWVMNDKRREDGASGKCSLWNVLNAGLYGTRTGGWQMVLGGRCIK